MDERPFDRDDRSSLRSAICMAYSTTPCGETGLPIFGSIIAGGDVMFPRTIDLHKVVAMGWQASQMANADAVHACTPQCSSIASPLPAHRVTGEHAARRLPLLPRVWGFLRASEWKWEMKAGEKRALVLV